MQPPWAGSTSWCLPAEWAKTTLRCANMCAAVWNSLGLEFDADVNRGLRGKDTILTKPASRVKAALIATNEEPGHRHRYFRYRRKTPVTVSIRYESVVPRNKFAENFVICGTIGIFGNSLYKPQI